MSTQTKHKAESTTNLLNPIIGSVLRTFERMLQCVPRRSGLELKHKDSPKFPLSAIVALTGDMNGTIVFSVSEEVSLEIVRRLLGEEVHEINSDVCDAVGEIANMIAGSAKAELEHLNLTLGIPNMVVGMGHEVYYPPEVTNPLCIYFESDMGQFMIEFGFRE